MLPRVAAEQYQVQQGIAALTAATVDTLWRGMGDDFDESWARVGPEIVGAVELGRRATVAQALPYTSSVLRETGQPDLPVGQLNAAAFLSSAPDGRDLGSLYAESVVGAKGAVGRGATAQDALAQSGRWLTMVSLTVLADTRREVYAADITQRPNLTGYVRMLNPPSCKRCIILAGRWYRWNAGFRRHPRCDCMHIPAPENAAGDIRTDPYAMFESMAADEQERVFGRIEARAIRDGADIYRVVNISQRGLGTARSARLYGTPSRMTVDDIYRVAGTRKNAIRLMQENGYITGPQVAGGNIIGTGPQAAGFGALGRGGTRRAASNAVLQANATGIRDPLNRYTMTAAERRLYDAHYRLAYAQRNGVVPRSIGRNSADRYVKPTVATPERLATLSRAYEREIAKLSTRAGDGMRDTASALGIRVTGNGVTSPLTGGAGGAGRVPPRRGGPPMPPPDPADKPAWESHWRWRQEALALDTGGDRLEPREIQFLERFLVDNRVRWIPKDRDTFLPTNDFVWVNNGGLLMELKSTSAKYQSVRNHVHETVRRALVHGVAKENFVIDLGDAVLTQKLRNQLSQYNARTTSTPIRRLFVMSRDGFEEIVLRTKG